MLEFPEAAVIAQQLNETVSGKKIMNVTAAQSPHKFAWFFGDPQNYHDLLTDKIIGKAAGFGGLVEIKADGIVILVGDGVGLKFHNTGEQRPQKHQLLIEFEDFSAISASVQMYGGLWCFKDGEFDNSYYKLAKEKPSPMSGKFDKLYFDRLISSPEVQKLSAKAFLATEQRIPGLGNGVLQDILYNAKIHPKKKINALTGEDKEALFNSTKSTLAEMTFQGGRDTERDLFGCPGGYKTNLSKNTAGKPCPVCGTTIKKEVYMGGSIYFCSGCQKL
jgi:formamidopyrimidine-DNA glycosylase